MKWGRFTHFGCSPPGSKSFPGSPAAAGTRTWLPQTDVAGRGKWHRRGRQRRSEWITPKTNIDMETWITLNGRAFVEGGRDPNQRTYPIVREYFATGTEAFLCHSNRCVFFLLCNRRIDPTRPWVVSCYGEIKKKIEPISSSSVRSLPTFFSSTPVWIAFSLSLDKLAF